MSVQRTITEPIWVLYHAATGGIIYVMEPTKALAYKNGGARMGTGITPKALRKAGFLAVPATVKVHLS